MYRRVLWGQGIINRAVTWHPDPMQSPEAWIRNICEAVHAWAIKDHELLGIKVCLASIEADPATKLYQLELPEATATQSLSGF